MQVDTTWNMTSLVLTRAERQDAGQYSLTLENPHGAATLKAEVIVVGEALVFLTSYLLRYVLSLPSS